MTIIHGFMIQRPEFECTHEYALNWLVEAHTRAEAKIRAHEHVSFDSESFKRLVRKALERYGCRPDHIGRRGHVLKEYCPGDPSSWVVFGDGAPPEGLGMKTRIRIFEKVVDESFLSFYASIQDPPPQIIHVTCTGYVSPSGAQKLVSKKNWNTQTQVMHAYHMGCSAAVPALRMARALISAESMSHVDVVHTELCTLHLNPSLHTPEQLVVQSLFADGMIRYSVAEEGKPGDRPAFEILALSEEMAPSSLDAMGWRLTDWGMQMVLSSDIPGIIAERVGGFVDALCAKAGWGKAPSSAVYAVHPGGPKILDLIQERLGLDAAVMRFSRSVLFECGNMSSATLPHIWARILEDPSVPDGTPVVSLAFGPGLTLCGALLRKRSC